MQVCRIVAILSECSEWTLDDAAATLAIMVTSMSGLTSLAISYPWITGHKDQATPNKNDLYSKLNQNKEIISKVFCEKEVGFYLRRKAKLNLFLSFFYSSNRTNILFKRKTPD